MKPSNVIIFGLVDRRMYMYEEISQVFKLNTFTVHHRSSVSPKLEVTD